ncbi:MAG: ABC transporter ATP-binding protein [Caldilineales bacterium]|nr:ABC transporter ATP-binding protein [Caldilineales bacterium]
MTISNRSSAYDLRNAVSNNRLSGLWRMMTGYQGIYLAATISLGVAAIAKTGTYFLLRYFVDDVLGQGFGWQYLVLIALGFIALALLEGLFTFLSGRWAAATAEGTALRLRNYLYDHIQRLNFTYHDKMQTGELIQRCTSDVEAVRRFYADQAIGLGRIVILFVVNFIAIALMIDWRLALLSVVVVPVLIVVSIFFFRRVSQRYKAYQEQDGKLQTTLQENLSGVRVVKAFARQSYEIDKFEEDNAERYRRGAALMLMHSLYWPSSDLLAGFQMLFGFTLAAIMAINGAITVGDYLAYAGLIIWIIWPMRNLGRIIVQMSTGFVSYDRVTELVKENKEPLTIGDYRPEGDVAGEIIFDDVNFGYDGGERVLRHISFVARPGQKIALLGSTGSGKTSLVNLLPRFYEYNSGHITLDGVELNTYPRDYLRSQIGIVEQEPFLFSRTIRQNITYGVEREISDEEVFAAAEAAAVHDVILSFPEGYDTLVGERGVTLSGGQKQRVAIARALLRDPRILILDDATSSVDTETESSIRAALARLMEGRTTFIIAHRIQTIMDADLIVVLDKGEIVQYGDHDSLLAQPGPYRQIYDIQTQIEVELERDLDAVAV